MPKLGLYAPSQPRDSESNRFHPTRRCGTVGAGTVFARSDQKPKTKRKLKRSTSQSRARLSLALLVYWLGVVGVITLAPFDFYLPTTLRFANIGAPFAVVASAFLFVPLGFLYPLTRRGREQSPTLVAAFGVLLGGAIALAQVCQTEREASLAGIVASGIGAGALLLRTANSRIRARSRLAGRLSLELPLVALIYLLIPLLLAASLSVVDDRLQAISLVPLTLLGARLISAVHKHHFAPASVFGRHEIAIIGAG